MMEDKKEDGFQFFQKEAFAWQLWNDLVDTHGLDNTTASQLGREIQFADGDEAMDKLIRQMQGMIVYCLQSRLQPVSWLFG